jgi:DNA-binding LacI/PurR family transcriptional regulator
MTRIIETRKKNDRGTGNIKALIHELALKNGPNTKLPTVRELCSSLGTNTVAITSVLKELESQNIICRRERNGIFVSPAINRKTILVVIDHVLYNQPTVSPFWGMLWSLFAKEADERASHKDEDFNFHMFGPQLSEERPLPDYVASAVASGRIHGVLAIGLSHAAVQAIERQGVPVVSFAAYSNRVVAIETHSVIELGVESLGKQGCRSIGFWRFDLSNIAAEHLLSEVATFENALSRVGLSADRRLVVTSLPGLESGAPMPSFQDLGYAAAMHVFGDRSVPKPDGLVISDDMMTDGAIAAFEELGLRVGTEVKIATQGNVGSPILYGHQNELTLIEYDPREIVSEMLTLLDGAMEGEKPLGHSRLVYPKVRQPGSAHRGLPMIVEPDSK